MGRRAANQTAVTFAALGVTACVLANIMEMLIAARFVGSQFIVFSDAAVVTFIKS